MKVTDSTGRNYHGKMGNIIYYTRGKQTYARRVSLPKTGKAERANERSEKQRLSSNRFKTLQVLYSLYKANVSPDIWRQAAREEGKMSSNLFHALNYRCFNGDGRLIDPESFCFSAGRLLLPPGIQTEAGSDGIFRVSWGKGEEWTTAASSDRLQIGVFVIDAHPHFERVSAIRGTRGEGQGEFQLLPREGAELHLYLYFSREDGLAHSPSHYIGRIEATQN